MIERHLWSLIVAIPVLMLTRWMAKSIPYKKQVKFFCKIKFFQGFFCEDLEIRLPLYDDTVDINDMFKGMIVISIVMVIKNFKSINLF